MGPSFIGDVTVKRHGKPRVFLGLSDICGYYSQLEEGLRARGVPTTFVNAFPDRPYRRKTQPDAFGRLVEWLGAKRNASSRGSLRRKGWMALQAVVLPVYGATALARFDVFVFASGQSFLLGRDREVLRLFGKRVISVCHGTDSRPPYMSGAFVAAEGPVDVARIAEETRALKRFVRALEETSDVVIQHPLTGQLHERPFVNWFEIGIPSTPREVGPTRRRERDEVVILHAPTRPGPKGTREIERAIASLEAKGHRIRFEKIVGRPPSEVLAALADCDFVVDELYSDTPLAGFAAEAACFGKPAVVGSYGADELAVACKTEEPVCQLCHPDDIEVAIEKMIVDEDLRHRLGRAAHDLVRRKWSAEAVAQRFERLMDGSIPSDWWVEPNEVRHAHGWGLRETRVAEVLRSLVARFGAEALSLGEKPALEARMTALRAAQGSVER